MPARGPRREEAADGDTALGRGSGWEAPTEPPRPLEGKARFGMAEVGWDWDRGTTQPGRGALRGHGHGQHRRPQVHSTEHRVYSNSAWSCGPKGASEKSHVHSARTFSFKHGGHRDTKHLREKAEDKYVYISTQSSVPWRSQKHKVKSSRPCPRDSHSPAEFKLRQVLEPDRLPVCPCPVTTSCLA